jgi:hypothetical protein
VSQPRDDRGGVGVVACFVPEYFVEFEGVKVKATGFSLSMGHSGGSAICGPYEG